MICFPGHWVDIGRHIIYLSTVLLCICQTTKWHLEILTGWYRWQREPAAVNDSYQSHEGVLYQLGIIAKKTTFCKALFWSDVFVAAAVVASSSPQQVSFLKYYSPSPSSVFWWMSFNFILVRIHSDKSYHCDVCNVCLDKRLLGNHKCRPDSGHDECCICLEVKNWVAYSNILADMLTISPHCELSDLGGSWILLCKSVTYQWRSIMCIKTPLVIFSDVNTWLGAILNRKRAKINVNSGRFGVRMTPCRKSNKLWLCSRKCVCLKSVWGSSFLCYPWD